MKYKGNPVFQKEIKLRIRTVKFMLAVLSYNLFLLLIVVIGFEMVFNIRWNNYVDYSGVNKVYLAIACLETLMIIFMVPVFTAGSIAGEREKQTLDILMTTAVSPRQIIWGKLTSCISSAVLLVFSSLPIVSIVLTVGGVGLSDLFVNVFVLFLESVFIGSIGILASVLFRKTVHAVIFSFGVVLFLCLGSAAIVAVAYLAHQMYYGNVMHGVGAVPHVSWILLILLLNPAVTVVQLAGSQYGEVRRMYSFVGDMGGLPPVVLEHWSVISLVIQMLCAVVLLLLSEKLLDPLRAPVLSEKR